MSSSTSARLQLFYPSSSSFISSHTASLFALLRRLLFPNTTVSIKMHILHFPQTWKHEWDEEHEHDDYSLLLHILHRVVSLHLQLLFPRLYISISYSHSYFNDSQPTKCLCLVGYLQVVVLLLLHNLA